MADIKIGRGYTYWFDSAGIHFTDGVATIIWTGAWWTSGLYDVLRDDDPHLFIVDFEFVGGTSWQMKYSVDGAPWQTRGTMVGVPPILAGSPPWTTEPHPIVESADDMAMDEAVLWFDIDPELDNITLEAIHDLGLGGFAIDDCRITCPAGGPDMNDPLDPCHCDDRQRRGLPTDSSRPFCTPYSGGGGGGGGGGGQPPGPGPDPPPACPGCEPPPAIKPIQGVDVQSVVYVDLGDEYVQEVVLFPNSGSVDTWELEVKGRLVTIQSVVRCQERRIMSGIRASEEPVPLRQ